MSLMSGFSRRGFLRFAAAVPLLSQIAAKNAIASAAAAVGKDVRGNVYTRLGLKTIINCRGTWTYLSGSLEFPGGYTVKDCVQQLRSGDPVIEVAGADKPSIVTAVREGNPKQSTKEMEANQRRKLELVASTIQPSETLIVGQRIRELLSAARKAAPQP